MGKRTRRRWEVDEAYEAVRGSEQVVLRSEACSRNKGYDRWDNEVGSCYVTETTKQPMA